jgi:hypothetical protein
MTTGLVVVVVITTALSDIAKQRRHYAATTLHEGCASIHAIAYCCGTFH